MTMQDDDQIDALVRAASACDVDEARLSQAVLTRIRDGQQGLFGMFSQNWRVAPAGFAAVLAITPVLITQLPGNSEEDLIAALVTGGPVLVDASFVQFLAEEAFE
jgi:hypothetical protein